MATRPIIPCNSVEGWQAVVEAYALALRAAAPSIGMHGMTAEQFIESGLFQSAVERIRGQNAATMGVKKAFIAGVLILLKEEQLIADWAFAGSDDRHDYQVTLPNGRICCIEAKGCLDGNNTNIFRRPANADEFFIWSLCQNPGSDPRRNVWSGIHTRLGAEIVSQKGRVDGLIVWDMLCGTLARPCPKIASDPNRAVEVAGKSLPPPCIYLFPRSIPDARNNPAPPAWKLQDMQFLNVLANFFRVPEAEVFSIEIHAQVVNNNTQRKTRLIEQGVVTVESSWTDIRRAS